MKLHAELVWDVFMHIGSACMERSIFSFHCFTLAVPFFIKHFGWLEKDKSGSLVLLKGG